MSRVGFQTEAEMAAVVRQWLLAERWDVYQEVGVSPYADLVARRGPVLWVIECKLTFSLAVMEQAHGWVRHANLVSVAVPQRRNSGFARVLCGELGIGVLVAQAGDSWVPARVDEELTPKLRRTRSDRLESMLRPEHRTYCQAGTANGSRFTPFRATCEELSRHVAAHPGCTLREAIDSILHHYCSSASARTHLRKLLEAGVVPELRLQQDGKALTLWPTTEGRDVQEAS